MLALAGFFDPELEDEVRQSMLDEVREEWGVPEERYAREVATRSEDRVPRWPSEEFPPDDLPCLRR